MSEGPRREQRPPQGKRRIQLAQGLWFGHFLGHDAGGHDSARPGLRQ